jgi:hypothetical protein
MRDDVLHRGHVGPVAGEHLEGQRQALGRADQTDAHLFAVAALIARVAALGLRIALGLAFEVTCS